VGLGCDRMVGPGMECWGQHMLPELGIGCFGEGYNNVPLSRALEVRIGCWGTQ